MINAVEYIKEMKRMCESYGQDTCYGCPFYEINGYMGCLDIEEENPEMAVTVVEQWSALNSIITNADKFEEIFGITVDTRFIPCSWWDKPYEGKI